MICWYDLCSEYFCRNFLGEEKNWSNANGLKFLGHMDKDDEADGSLRGGSYHIMRALRLLDVPGVDAIHRQIYPDKSRVEAMQRKRKDGKFCVEKANGFFPRYASSAAAQIGGRHALTESFAVYGNGLTFSEMRYVLNFQAVRGINVFNLMLIPYGRTGFFRSGELPHFTEKNGFFADLPVFNRYCERLAYLASLGERRPNVALYYPIRDSYLRDGYNETATHYERVGEALEKGLIDFDIFDDDFIADAEDGSLDKGRICIGKACYDTIVFPYCRYVSEKTKTRIERFVRGGGNVISVKTTGNAFCEIAGAALVSPEKLSSLIKPTLDISGKKEAFRVSKIEFDNGELYFIFNEDKEKT